MLQIDLRGLGPTELRPLLSGSSRQSVPQTRLRKHALKGEGDLVGVVRRD